MLTAICMSEMRLFQFSLSLSRWLQLDGSIIPKRKRWAPRVCSTAANNQVHRVLRSNFRLIITLCGFRITVLLYKQLSGSTLRRDRSGCLGHQLSELTCGALAENLH